VVTGLHQIFPRTMYIIIIIQKQAQYIQRINYYYTCPNTAALQGSSLVLYTSNTALTLTQRHNNHAKARPW